MIDRRRFISTLSTSAFLAAVPDVADNCVEQPASTSRARTSLNGEWEQYVDGQPYSIITVPSSLRPSGFYSLQRHFMLPRLGRGQRIFVHFEGVTYWGQVSINGQKLGRMEPYVPHESKYTSL